MSESPFEIRGVVEGFYGVFYTHAEREDLIRFLGQHGYNLYIYAPKHDRYHRDRWRAPYPAPTLARLGQTIHIAREAGVEFCYALSPGLSMCFTSPDDFAALTAKFQAFYNLGVRAFTLFLDDIAPVFHYAADRARYATYAAAHVDLCNRVHEWLIQLDPACTLSMCPTDYAGFAPFSSYVHELGAGLDPAIDVFYTGPQVCSTTITAGDAVAFGEAIRRSPLIWDNYPVNDADMVPDMHIGPIRGRDAGLHRAVRGIVANPMNQAEASKIALATFADYFAAPDAYDPDAAWDSALVEVAGAPSREAIRLFAENSLRSCLATPEAERLQSLAAATLAALEGDQGIGHPDVQRLETYLDRLDDACYHLLYEMENTALRSELLPWIELLELWVRVGQRALTVLHSLESGPFDTGSHCTLRDLLAAVDRHPKRITGGALRPLADTALRQSPATPDDTVTG